MRHLFFCFYLLIVLLFVVDLCRFWVAWCLRFAVSSLMFSFVIVCVLLVCCDCLWMFIWFRLCVECLLLIVICIHITFDCEFLRLVICVSFLRGCVFVNKLYETCLTWIRWVGCLCMFALFVFDLLRVVFDRLCVLLACFCKMVTLIIVYFV